MNTTAALIFAFSGRVHWLETLTMMAAGMAGARIRLAVPQLYVRIFVMAIGCGLTVYFFIKPA